MFQTSTISHNKSLYCFSPLNKVETLVVDHLRDLGVHGEEFEVVEIFPMQEDREYGDTKNSEFYSSN